MFGLSKTKTEEDLRNIDISVLKKQLQAVQKVSQELKNITDLDKILDTVVYELGKELDYLNPVIYLVNEDKESFSVRKTNVPQVVVNLTSTFVGKSVYEVKFKLSDPNILAKTIREGTINTSSDFHEVFRPYLSEGPSKLVQSGLRIGSTVAIPIISNSTPIGCLTVASRNSKFDPNEIKVISTFADQISIAIYNAKSFKEKEERILTIEAQRNDLASLFNLSTQISKSLDPVEVAQNAVNSLPQNDFMSGGMILDYDEEKQQLWVEAVTQNPLSKRVEEAIGSYGQFKIDITAEEAQTSPVVQSIKTGALAYSNDLQSVLFPLPKRVAGLAAKLIQIKSVVSYPIKARGKVVGAVAYFLQDKTYDQLDENKKQLFNTYTLQTTIALENAHLYAESQATRQHLEDALYQLKEARRQERDMIDVMGHELRTPISIVRNALVMVEKQMERQRMIASTDLHKYMDMALESTRREITLIETLLSATKVDAARMQLYFTKVGIKDVINDGIEGQKAQLEKKQEVTVTYNPPVEDIFVYADRTRMQEIMDNLYSNAVKYTLKGNITISTWQDKDFGWLSISDQGIGISAEDLQNLGKKFFRAKQYIGDGGEVEDTEVVRPGGTGLGLYVTYDLVRIMGGTLYINSEVGKGSTFTVSIPIHKGQPDKQIDEALDLNEKGKNTHIVINGKLPKAPTSQVVVAPSVVTTAETPAPTIPEAQG